MRSAFRLPDLSLRARLLVLLVGLAVVGLAAADFASYRALHNYLFTRVDQQLESAFRPVTAHLLTEAGEEGSALQNFGPGPGGATGAAGETSRPDAGGPGPGQLPDTAYGQLRDAE